MRAASKCRETTVSAERDALLSERVLNSMRDGVMAIDLNGRVIMFNEAAGEILRKDPAKVIGQPFTAQGDRYAKLCKMKW